MSTLVTLVSALLSGLLFGLGLLVSGMNNPHKVRAFLDIGGHWQPELIAVMGSAVILFALAFYISRRMARPWFAGEFHTPMLTVIDARLLSGAALFGIGWGMVGLCPGPALVNLASLDPAILGFVLMVLVGNRLAHWLVGPATAAR